MEEFMLTATFPVKPQRIYDAWLDTHQHTAMTGAEAEVSEEVGGSFTAWDGYISGTNLELDPVKYIRQSWRTTEFEESDPDSFVELHFEQIKGGTKVSLYHSNIPQGQSDYKQGWKEFYFQPMQAFFSKNL